MVSLLISVHIYGPRKDKACCPVFVFSKTYTSTNAIYDLVLYLLREGLEMSLMIYEDLPRFRYSFVLEFYSIIYKILTQMNSEILAGLYRSSIWEILGFGGCDIACCTFSWVSIMNWSHIFNREVISE